MTYPLVLQKSYLASLFHLMKNITPKQLALIIAGFLGAITLIGLSLLKLIFHANLSWAIVGVLTLLNFFSGYCLFYFALERFIYRRIKLIYKRIHRLKSPVGSEPEQVDMNQHIMDEVEAEVVKWSEENEAEIKGLKQLEEYRREFVGNVSHELKTPIFNIQGYIHTLIDSNLEDEEINMKYLKKAAKNASRLSAIVEDLEIITRHEAGKLQLNWSIFRIYNLAREVLETMDVSASEKNISLTFKDGCDKTALVNADQERIRQVLTNLITNSIKYNKKNGKTWIGIYDMHDYILVEVTDNGIGIAEKHLPHLFERFYRVDKSRSRKQGGSGLGLAIVKHIVEAHKQSIHARSKKKVGSTFGFTLAKAG